MSEGYSVGQERVKMHLSKDVFKTSRELRSELIDMHKTSVFGALRRLRRKGLVEVKKVSCEVETDATPLRKSAVKTLRLNAYRLKSGE